MARVNERSHRLTCHPQVVVVGLLLRPRERRRSIVMSTSVCVSVCPWAYLRNRTHHLYQFFCACCLWPWLGPPSAGWRNPKGKGQFWGFSSPLTIHCNAFAAKGSGREEGNRSSQVGRSVIYDCLVENCIRETEQPREYKREKHIHKHQKITNDNKNTIKKFFFKCGQIQL